MKQRLAMASILTVLFITALVVARPAAAQRGGHGANTPRANQGRIPPPPPARPNAGEARGVEHLPSGHTNDTPHVNHDTWYGHEAPNDPRFHLDHPYPHGRFPTVGPTHRFRVVRFDPGRHWFWFPGGFYFEVASWDWTLCADWCWDCGDDFVIYDDPDHVGWYLLYNIHTGVYVHVQFMGK